MTNIVSTCDLYEASYYYSNKCKLEKVEVISIGKKLICEFFFKGEGIYKLRDTCLKGNALINLSQFKSAYSQVLQEAYFAKKAYIKEGIND